MARGTTNIPAVVVIVRRDDKILFVRRANTGYQDGKLCIPGGHLEADESFTEAAVREVKEETDLDIEASQLRFVHVQQTFDGIDVRVHVFFELDSWRGEPVNAEPEVHSEMLWLSVSDLPYGDMMPLVAAGLKAVVGGVVYDELRWGN